MSIDVFLAYFDEKKTIVSTFSYPDREVSVVMSHISSFNQPPE